MSDVVLSIKDLHKSFDGNLILDGINLDVKQGEVIVIVGPSGIVEENTPDEFFTKPTTERAKKFLNVFEFDAVR